MSTISSDSWEFMIELQSNNKREWMEENKKRYQSCVQKPIKKLAESLSGPVSTILPEFTGKPKISRINNDLRFHKDKPLYKEHMWISFCMEPAELFCGIGANGWFVGAAKGGSKQEDLKNWHNNLLTYSEIWKRYADAIGLGDKVEIYPENPYKKLLYPDAPEYLQEILQARAIWIVDIPSKEFFSIPEKDFFKGLQKFLPIFIFMGIEHGSFEERINELGEIIIPADKEIEKLWKTLKI